MSISKKEIIIPLIILGMGYALYRYGLYLNLFGHGFLGYISGLLIWVGFIIIAGGSSIIYFAVLGAITDFFKLDIKPDSNVNFLYFISFSFLWDARFTGQIIYFIFRKK